MKKLKLLLTILIVFTFLSCSSEDNPNPNLDPLIGIWKPIKEVETYVDNSTTEFDFSSCTQMSRFIFNQDGTLDIVEFANDEISGNCEKRTEPVLTFGSWEKISDEKYRLITTYTYTTNQQSYTDDDIPDVFKFENNYNTVKIGYADDEIINGKQLQNYYTVFIRVE
jgi:hypothetical protein